MVRTLCVGVFVVAAGISAARADDKKEDPTIAILKARLEAQDKELQTLRKRVEKLEDERVKLILEKEAALREAVTAKNEAKLARSIAVEAEKKIEDLTVRLRELKGLPVPKPRDDSVAAQIRGTVTQVNAEFLLVNIGIDSGLEPGAVLEVVRIDGKNETVLGKATITKSLYPKEAVGAFTPARKVSLKELKPDELPRKGDTVRVPTADPRK